MKIRACIIMDIPDQTDKQEALEEIESALENAIDNDDLVLIMRDGIPLSVDGYKITVEEVTE